MVTDLLDEIESETLYFALVTVDRRTLQIVLLKMQGYSTKEITPIVHLTVGAVYARLAHLRKKLRSVRSQRTERSGRKSGFIIDSSALSVNYILRPRSGGRRYPRNTVRCAVLNTFLALLYPSIVLPVPGRYRGSVGLRENAGVFSIV